MPKNLKNHFFTPVATMFSQLKRQTYFVLDVLQEKFVDRNLWTLQGDKVSWSFPVTLQICCHCLSPEPFQVANGERPTQLCPGCWSSFSLQTGSVDLRRSVRSDGTGWAAGRDRVQTRFKTVIQSTLKLFHTTSLRQATECKPDRKLTVNAGRHPTHKACHIQNITCSSKVVENSLSSECLPNLTLQNV